MFKNPYSGSIFNLGSILYIKDANYNKKGVYK